MRQEVVDFYDHHGIPVDRMVRVGVRRKGLTKESIRKAAEEVYDEVQAGREIEVIRLAWEVFGRSSHSKMSTVAIGSVYDAILDMDTKLYEAVLKLNNNLEEHMTPWYKKLWRWLT